MQRLFSKARNFKRGIRGNKSYSRKMNKRFPRKTGFKTKPRYKKKSPAISEYFPVSDQVEYMVNHGFYG